MGFLIAWHVGGRREGAEVSYLLFANDALIFYKASQEQRIHLCWLLVWFEALSGLKINLEKSELIPVGRINDVDLLAYELLDAR